MSPSPRCLTAVVLFAAACAADDGDSAVGVEPGQIAVEPASLDMGDLGLGENLSANLTISNTGAGPLSLYDVQVLDDRQRVAWTLMGTKSTVLQAGGSTSLVVSYSPQNLDDASTSLKVLSDDPDAPSLVVPLVAAAHGTPALRIDQSTVDVGQVAVGETATALVRIANDGTGELQILAASVTTTDGSWVLAVDPTGVGVAARTESGAALIDFTPPAPGVSNATLTLETDDPLQPTATVQLVGTGI